MNYINSFTVLILTYEKIHEVHKDDRRRGHEVRVHGVKVRRVRNIVVGIDYK